MIDRLAKPAARIALGLGMAALAQLLSVMLAGAGHGWVAPLFLSVALWVLLPLALWLAWPFAGSGDPWALCGLAAVAVGADAALVILTLGEFSHILFYIEVNGLAGMLIIGLWLCLWSFWQPLIFHALMAGRRRGDSAHVG